MSRVILKLENLYKNYKNITALKGISFEIKEGELFALLGPNGAGKTTTIRIIAGLTKLTKGKIFLYQKEITQNSLWAKKLIGLVPQYINLDLELTVEENLLIHGLLYQMPLHKIKEKIKHLLELADVKERKNTRVRELSEGLKRRILIIRALLHEPKILLLDEPTVGLDPHIRRKIWAFIKKIQSQGTTILLTTHYMEEAEFLADRVAFIFSGSIIKIDTPQNFIKSLGNFALDVYFPEGLKTFYFKDKNQAEEKLLYFTKKNYFVSLRRVTLEDVFINYIERKS